MRSLNQRITRTMWLLSVTICCLTMVFVTTLVLRDSEERAKERIKAEQANLYALGLIDLISLNAYHDIVPRLPGTLQIDRLNEIIRVYEPSGHLLYTNLKIPDIDRADSDRFKMLNKDFYVIEGRTRSYLALLRSHRAFDGDVLWIEIATPRQRILTVAKEISPSILALFLILLLVSFFLSRYLTRRILVPLTSISQKMDEIHMEDFKSWEPLSALDQPEEFGTILGKVNELLRRIQNAFLQSHQMAQFVTHEVRTPLTVLRGEIETLLMNDHPQPEEYEAVLRSSLEEVHKIEEIVTSVLQLSDREKVRTVNPVSTRLSLLLDQLIPKIERWTKRSVLMSVSEDVDLFVDSELLTLLISNLLRNVAVHTPSESIPHIEFHKAGADLGTIVIWDSGPGLPAKVLEAANRPALSDRELGVGLSLCKKIANICHLSLQFENRPERGLKVSITCPLART